MSVIKALQTYIQQYKDMEMLVLTDRVDEQRNSFAIYPSGNSKVKSDILGNKTYHKSYIFLAKMATGEEFERSGNYDFLEGFCDWIENNTENGIFPDLGEKYTVESLEVSNIMLMDISAGWDLGTYQIQINLQYTKECF